MGLNLKGWLASVLAALALSAAQDARADAPDARFREATTLARAGDYPRAIAIYRELAEGGTQSASLYWNWAQAAQARGATGEALWALLRARELDPGDRALERALEQLRGAANLDAAELAPEPLQAVRRFARRARLDLAGLALLVVSLALHVAARARPLARGAWVGAWCTALGGLLLAGIALCGAAARDTAVVVTRGAPLLEAASPGATAVGTLREGEVVPILERGGAFLRIEDSAGSRGWSHVEDVRPLQGPLGDAPYD